LFKGDVCVCLCVCVCVCLCVSVCVSVCVCVCGFASVFVHAGWAREESFMHMFVCVCVCVCLSRYRTCARDHLVRLFCTIACCDVLGAARRDGTSQLHLVVVIL
jgi:hypothetical protein